ncbi:hypothetical protein YB2330_000207 [Saitoella coloradoensis]
MCAFGTSKLAIPAALPVDQFVLRDIVEDTLMPALHRFEQVGRKFMMQHENNAKHKAWENMKVIH